MEERNRTRGKRLTLWAGLLVALVVVAIGALVYANVPHTFVTNETLTADNLNGNFTALDNRVTTLETTATTIPTITKWASYTVAVSAGTTAITTQTSTAFWRRVGDTADISIDTMFASCTPTGALRWSLPPGVVVDATKLANTNMLIGSGMTFGPAGLKALFAFAQGLTSYIIPDLTTGAGGGLKCTDIGTGDVDTRLMFSVPVQGW